MQCMRVDLPEPDGPMIAVKWPAREVDVDVVEGDDLGVAGAVGLGGAAGGSRGERGVSGVGGLERVMIVPV